MLTLNPSGAFSCAPSGLGTIRDGLGWGAEGTGNCGARCCPTSAAHTDNAPIDVIATFEILNNRDQELFETFIDDSRLKDSSPDIVAAQERTHNHRTKNPTP